jgi:acid phosphatase (class A)
MNPQRLASSVLVLILLTGCAGPATFGSAARPGMAVRVQQGGSETWSKPPAGYLAAGTAPDGAAITGPPPEPGSPRGKADRAAYDSSRRLANTPIWDKAIADADLSGREGFKSFSCAAGVTISPEATPTLTRMLLRMTSDAALVYEPAKSTYQRPRPPVGNDKPICVPREPWIKTSGSYPSGHSLIGWSWALVVAELAPEHASQVLVRGREFGESRVICGVHFPSDIEAGRTLGAALVSRLHADPAFEADLAQARIEIAASKTAGPPRNCPA